MTVDIDSRDSGGWPSTDSTRDKEAENTNSTRDTTPQEPHGDGERESSDSSSSGPNGLEEGDSVESGG